MVCRCIYEIQKAICKNVWRLTITKLVWQQGWCKPSFPSTKKLHGLGIKMWSGLYDKNACKSTFLSVSYPKYSKVLREMRCGIRTLDVKLWGRRWQPLARQNCSKHWEPKADLFWRKRSHFSTEMKFYWGLSSRINVSSMRRRRYDLLRYGHLTEILMFSFSSSEQEEEAADVWAKY